MNLIGLPLVKSFVFREGFVSFVIKDKILKEAKIKINFILKITPVTIKTRASQAAYLKGSNFRGFGC